MDQNFVYNPEKIYFGITNIGKKPTFGENSINIETWIFDFKKDIYGQNLEVIPLHQIRSEKKFPGVSVLKKQIDLDIMNAKNYLNKKGLLD